MVFGNEKRNALKNISHQNSFVGTVFTRMVPTPLSWVFWFFVLFFPCFFMLHPYLYLYLICFTFRYIMANVQIFFVNNVLGFAKKENKPFQVCPRINET